jgi:hypothetical protein
VTIAVSGRQRKVSVDGEDIDVVVWDSGGGEDFRGILHNCVRRADLLFLLLM